MRKTCLKVTAIVLAAGLTACSHMPSMSIPGFGSNGSTTQAPKNGVVATTVDQKTGQEVPANLTNVGGEQIGLKSMDEIDKSKMSHALDGAPGKSTTWQNGATNISYTVTPIKKVVINGNPFCRAYTVAVSKGDYKSQINATACVSTDGSWHTV